LLHRIAKKAKQIHDQIFCRAHRILFCELGFIYIYIGFGNKCVGHFAHSKMVKAIFI